MAESVKNFLEVLDNRIQKNIDAKATDYIRQRAAIVIDYDEQTTKTYVKFIEDVDEQPHLYYNKTSSVLQEGDSVRIFYTSNIDKGWVGVVGGETTFVTPEDVEEAKEIAVVTSIATGVGAFTNKEKNSEVFNGYVGRDGSMSYSNTVEANQVFFSHVEGATNKLSRNTNLGWATHIEGLDNTVEAGTGTHVEGAGHTIKNGDQNYGIHVEGGKNQVTGGNFCHIEGGTNKVTNVTGAGAHIEGWNNTVSGNVTGSSLGGQNNVMINSAGSELTGRGNDLTDGDCVIVSGNNNTVKDSRFSLYQGYSIQGKADDCSLVISNNVTTTDTYRTFVLGYNCTATDTTNSVVIGNDIVAEGLWNSVVVGNGHNVSGGQQTLVVGNNCNATGRSSQAFGYNTQAINSCAHAEGNETIATGTQSHAEGYNTSAIGDNTHAEGCMTTAVGHCSHAGGNRTITQFTASTVVGFNNVDDYEQKHSLINSDIPYGGNLYDDVFIVGNGEEWGQKSTAFTVNRAGNAMVQNGLRSGRSAYAECFKYSNLGEEKYGYFVDISLQGSVRKSTCLSDKTIGITTRFSAIGADSLNPNTDYMYASYLNGEPKKDEKTNYTINSTGFIPLDQRQNYILVALYGTTTLIDDGSCVAGQYCKPNPLGKGTYSSNKTAFYVKERVDNTHINVIIVPAFSINQTTETEQRQEMLSGRHLELGSVEDTIDTIKEVSIIFETEFEFAPIVTANLISSLGFISVKDITKTGFIAKIKLIEGENLDYSFNWTAVYNTEDYIITNNFGTNDNLSIYTHQYLSSYTYSNLATPNEVNEEEN